MAKTLFGTKAPAKPDQDDLTAKMERIAAGKAAVQDPPKPVPIPVQDQAAANAPPPLETTPSWVKKTPAKVKTTVVRCIVIEQADHWHNEAQVDLKGMDTSAFSWGYYGVNLPVLVEQKDRTLKPFYLPDAAGESSNRLFKGANPDGFRATFKHRSNLLQKIQVGLMVALVLGLFFIMFILINNK